MTMTLLVALGFLSIIMIGTTIVWVYDELIEPELPDEWK
jgi:hypothetical protein